VAPGWRERRDLQGHLIEHIRVGTVDAFQGMDFDVVFLSVTRSNRISPTDETRRRQKYGHLMLENRACVAMSRQKRLLIVVGDRAMIEGDVAAEAVRPLVRFHRDLCGGAHVIAH
jgi:superfamily I DNA and/or RNA helicase